MSLILVIAGLLGKYTDHSRRVHHKSLRALLARADCSRLAGATSLEATLFALFNITPEAGSDLPVAAVTRVLDLAVIDKGWWLRADPVHLSPQRDRLILTDASQLDITQDEANRLCAEIAEVYKADGWLLKAPRPWRWYLKPQQAPRLLTTPLVDVIGRDIHPYLPQGRDGKVWHTILNEVQILLHTSKVNDEREKLGKPPINSLWFWGGGQLPPIGSPGLAQVMSNEPVALALARLTETPGTAPPENFETWIRGATPTGEHLVVLDRGRELELHTEPEGWMDYGRQLERDWFVPLLAALKSNRLASLRLVTDTGQQFHLTPGLARRWWRWARPLFHYC